ncbi:MAG: hypothetical protein FJ167_08270 [Gammaproteobacteria bacterium]|nr:hypothetical protein [Gammaproteobacteria bacterium]
MENKLNILAKDLHIGQEILADIYGDGEYAPLLITDIEFADGLRYDADGYSTEYADTLHTMRGALLRVSGITLDGTANECLLVHESDMVLLISK